jgi:hypothetical protein
VNFAIQSHVLDDNTPIEMRIPGKHDESYREAIDKSGGNQVDVSYVPVTEVVMGLEQRDLPLDKLNGCRT